MDHKTKKILASILFQKRLRVLIRVVCYASIIFGIFLYLSYSTSNKGNSIKMINSYIKNKDNYNSEKIMVNPRIKFQYNNGQIYDIKAKKAKHSNFEETILYDVYAQGNIGNINAGELSIYKNGDIMIFKDNPVLILKDQINVK